MDIKRSSNLNLNWLISLSILTFPVYTTLAVLCILQTVFQQTGHPLMFLDNSLITAEYCQTSFGITPRSRGEIFTLNPNQWGWTPGEPGGLCMNVVVNRNGTYATKSTGPKFSATWQYTPGPSSEPVRAFPNIKPDFSKYIPAHLQDLEKINVDMEWTYGVGNDTAAFTNATQLEEVSFNADVAIDMFFDADMTTAKDPNKAAKEVMVWLAKFGPNAIPIGLVNGSVTSETLGDITFDLYHGLNSAQQHVFSWVASTTVDKLDIDIYPLIQRLFSMNKPGFPSPIKTDYIGYLAMGSEAMSSDAYVTFSAPALSVDFHKKASRK